MFDKIFKEKNQLKGTVERRLFDTEKLKEARKAMEQGASQDDVESMLDEAAKPQFADNFVWRILNKVLSIDLKVPYLTGNWTTAAIKRNLVPTRGKQIAAEQIGGTTTAPVTAIAIGTGTTGPSASDTALGSEITTGGGSRGAASISNETTGTTNDTERWQKTFSFTSGFAVTEEGLFDNNASGGNMLARQVFSAINVTSGDSLQITHDVQVT